VQFKGIDLGERSGRALGGDEEHRASIVLSPKATSLSAARVFVSAMLEVWGCEDPDQVAGLLTTELVSNAVRHAESAVGLEVEMIDARLLRVRASDDDPDAVVAPDSHRRGSESEGGHGLRIVETLAQRWGVERYGDHKVVWFETCVVPHRRV
jgi:anti-sigma regulatory factor (Ser/Thr protein kinase)